VLIPRPETELLVVAVLDLAKTKAEGGRGTAEGESGKAEGGRGKEEGLGTSVPSEAANDQSSVSTTQQSEIRNQKSETPHPLIADVGTGSGIIAVCLAKHLTTSRVTAIDISHAALAVAKDNAQQHGVAARIEFFESNLFAAVPADRRFDFVVSNPPYVTTAEIDKLAADVRKFEPRAALVAGPRGTEVIEKLVVQAADRLRPGGHLLVEISPTIHDAVRAIFEADGRFELGPTIKDFARLPRVVQARRRD
jgi:release factor glutamine methyltransferase